MFALTLVCCSLLASPLLGSQLLFAVAPHRAIRHALACPLPHLRCECRVVQRLVRAVGTKHGGTHMLLDLSAAQHAWSAAALLRLQRLRCAVPLAVPAEDGCMPSAHSEATSECGEAGTPLTGAVVCEDGVLVLWCVVLHASWREGGGTECGREGATAVHVEKQDFSRRPIAHENEERRVEDETMYKHGKTSQAHPLLVSSHWCLPLVLRGGREDVMDFWPA